MKSVPNLIFYLHEFFWIFSQFLAIYFELFSSGVIFKFENLSRVGPTCQTPRAVAAWLPRAVPLARLKLAVETARRASRQPRPLADSLALRRRPQQPCPLAPSSRPPRSEATDAGPSPCRLTARPSPSCRAAVPAPVSRHVPRSSPVRRRRAVVGSPCSAAAVRHARAHAVRRALRGPAELGRARCAGRGQPRPRLVWLWAAHAVRASAASTGRAHVAVGHAPAWPRAAPALCNWAERGFGPVALDLNFIFSEYIQFIANSKILLEMFQSVLYYKNIIKIIPVPDFPVNFNPFKASLNL
jgi:hypothetical protein